jgi:hypothetical protein
VNNELEGSGLNLNAVLFWNFLGVTEENHNYEIAQNSWCPIPDSNRAPREYMSRLSQLHHYARLCGIVRCVKYSWYTRGGSADVSAPFFR